jgi:hypothetical protein
MKRRNEMAKQTLWSRIRQWIGGIGFDVFCWSIGMTGERYVTTIATEGIYGYFFPDEPPMKYWQHDETGRLCAVLLQPSETWHEITEMQYKEAEGEPSKPSDVGNHQTF